MWKNTPKSYDENLAEITMSNKVLTPRMTLTLRRESGRKYDVKKSAYMCALLEARIMPQSVYSGCGRGVKVLLPKIKHPEILLRPAEAR